MGWRYTPALPLLYQVLVDMLSCWSSHIKLTTQKAPSSKIRGVFKWSRAPIYFINASSSGEIGPSQNNGPWGESTA
jgi:hypothetical protein